MAGQKDTIRREARARRRSLTEAQRTQLAPRIWHHLLQALPPSTQRVAIYASVGTEVPTEGLAPLLNRRGIQVLYPRCLRQRMLEFVPVEGPHQLQPGHLGIPAPLGSAVQLQHINVVVLPGLAFDALGGRLGTGGGYYDRTLPGFAGLRLGLAFDCQLVNRVPALAHDQNVHGVVTESGVRWAGGVRPDQGSAWPS